MIEKNTIKTHLMDNDRPKTAGRIGISGTPERGTK